MSKQKPTFKFSFLASGSIFNRSLSFSRSFFFFFCCLFSPSRQVTFFLAVELGTSTVLATSLSSFKMSYTGVSWFASISSTKFFPYDNLFLWIFDIAFLNTDRVFFLFFFSIFPRRINLEKLIKSKMNKGDLWLIKV